MYCGKKLSAALFAALMLASAPSIQAQPVRPEPPTESDRLMQRALQGEAEARNLIMDLARRGNLEATLDAAWLLDNGIGTPLNPQRALTLYNEAAAKGDGVAAYWLGKHYELGSGVVQDQAQAVRWFNTGAERGCVRAMVALARHLRDGSGIAQDSAKAVALFEKVAAMPQTTSTRTNSVSNALLYAGLMYYEGQGVEQNPPKAVAYFERSAKLGNPWAEYYIGNNAEHGYSIVQNYPLAARAYLQAAAGGVPNAWTDLARLYLEGLGVPKDPAKAAHWYKAAADQGIPYGEYQYGRLLAQGLGTDKNTTGAEKLAYRLTDQHSGGGELLLGEMAQFGWAGKIDGNAALHHYQAAAQQSDGYMPYLALCRAGELYDQGIGMPANPFEAARLYRLGATLNTDQCALDLAELYSKGRGVNESEASAFQWANVALARTDPDSPIAKQAKALMDRVAAKMTPNQVRAARMAAATQIYEVTPPETSKFHR